MVLLKETLLKTRFLKEDYQKTFKKLTWDFPLPQFSFDGQDYEKQKRPVELATSLPLGCKMCL